MRSRLQSPSAASDVTEAPEAGAAGTAEHPGTLKRSLGPFLLTFSGLGIILGAGIYSVIGVAAGITGESVWLAFVASGAVAAFTAVAYAELATTYPKASAEFTYIERALPEVPSVATTIGLLVGFSGVATAASVALAFGGYLVGFVDVPPILTALVLLGVVVLVNVIGTRQAASVTALFTLVEICGLVAVIVVGANSPRFGDALASVPSASLAQGTALVFFAFLGFENIANLAEEAKRPSRDLPIAIFASLGIATLLYVLVALAVVALVSPATLGASDAPLVTAVRAGDPRIAGALGGVALFATANTALASILVASRVLYGMGRAKALPALLGRLLPKRKTPWLATVVTGAVAIALLPLGEVALVASVSSFAALVAFVCVDIALIVLRRRDPDRERPFRVPGAIAGVPVIAVVGILASVALMTQLDPRALVIGVVALAVLFGSSRAYGWWMSRSEMR